MFKIRSTDFYLLSNLLKINNTNIMELRVFISFLTRDDYIIQSFVNTSLM